MTGSVMLLPQLRIQHEGDEVISVMRCPHRVPGEGTMGHESGLLEPGEKHEIIYSLWGRQEVK